MNDSREVRLFFELFSGLPRQGPGDATSTLRALALVPGIGPDSKVLDLGCGTGLQTRILARNSPASFVAIDNHKPYVDELNRDARALGISDRLEGRTGDFARLDFPPESFDLIWSEGAICVIGFEAGLRAWQPLLIRGGHLAVTEVCWMKPDPPSELQAFWAAEYPAIRDVPSRLETIEACGYELQGHFSLPPSAWWDDYYRPLQENLISFRYRHQHEADAQRLADQVEREIDIWQAYSEFYGYEFFVMRRPSA